MIDDRIDELFSALAHSGRRRMLDLVMGAPGMSVKALTSHFEISRIAVLKHVRVLEETELLLSKKTGRTRSLFFNPIPIQQMHDRWSTKYSAFWSERMVDVKARVEERASQREHRKHA